MNDHESATYDVRPIGHVESPLASLGTTPKQADEGAPEAWLVLDDAVAPAAADLAPGDELVLITWLHAADRGVLTVRPRGDPDRPLTGVFSTRSPARPNPLGLHPVTVTAVDGPRIRVAALEALDGTPIVDLKPILGVER